MSRSSEFKRYEATVAYEAEKEAQRAAVSRDTAAAVARLSPEEVTEITTNLLARKRIKVKSDSVAVASLLEASMRFIKRPDLAEFAEYIKQELLNA